MPPKKKARQPSIAASVATDDGFEEHTKNVDPTTPEAEDLWTDEQEASLFKSMISYKPVGMHKHFRMIAISEHLRSNGYTSAQDEHTRPRGIWKKLGKLYNLEALDEIEDTKSLGYRRDGESSKEPFYEFDLPDEEYRDMMFARRLAPGRPSSPPSLPYQLHREGSRRRQSTVDDTSEARSSPASNRGARVVRGARGKRTSQLAELSRKGRRGSKASVDQSVDGNPIEEEEGDPMEIDPEVASKTAKERTGEIFKTIPSSGTLFEKVVQSQYMSSDLETITPLNPR
ncbi:MAG: hypothetical protein Q9163_004028 [Psora crenata]